MKREIKIMKKTLVLATTNQGKIIEFNQILKPLNFHILSRADLNFNNEIEETGLTFVQNAQIKAKACFNKLNMPTLADDSGLEIEALNNKPGVLSARYASTNGKACSNEQNIAKILKDMQNKPNKKAKMVCALCFINQFGRMFTIIEHCNGEITTKPKQLNGFGYDFIFKINNTILSELPTSEKNKISHRGKATQKLIQNIENWWLEKI